MIKVSIIVPIYNAEKYIGKCLESIINQTYENCEVILVNDGSNDASAHICDNYKKKYKNIIVINKKNEGSASARNVGLQVATGDYIAFIDADDFVDEKYIEYLVNVVKTTDAEIGCCDYYIVQAAASLYDVVKEKNRVKVIDNIQALNMFCSRRYYLKMVVLWNKLIKRDLFRNLYFPVGKGVDDEFVIYKVLYRAKKIAMIDEKLYYYVLSENSQMRSSYNIKKMDSVEAIGEQLDFLKETENHELYNKLLYRYCRIAMENYYILKKYFPDEKEKLKEMDAIRKKIFKALFVKEISIPEKIALLINYFPVRIK